METKPNESVCATVDRWLADMAAELNGRLSEESDRIKVVLEEKIPELRGGPRLVELLGASVQGNVGTILHTLQHDISAEHLEAPAAAMEYARRLAQHGVPVNALVRAYRLGQTAFLDSALTRITATGLAPELALAVAHRLLTVASGYIDWISQQVVDAYERERDRWQAAGSTRAVHVRELLARDATTAPSAEAALGYSLEQHHLAVVLWFPEGSETSRPLGDLERAAHDLAGAVRAHRPPLFVAVDRLSGWAWIPLGSQRTFDRRGINRLVTGRTDAPSVAVGTPAGGHHGFRRSHEQARTAHDVAVLRKPHPRRVTFYDEPGLPLVDLLAKDTEKARNWVAETLGPLAADNESAARLRNTLFTFLNSGSSHKAAAERLNLHHNTVKYRVKKAEEELGVAVADHRLGIELALLACDWLGGTVLGTAPAAAVRPPASGHAGRRP
ncbi:MAG TPA: helix-turn-helix domain-containing protein [Streptomyces sp.]|nr:helix-turn-helix domain-containing protein [Streptomyces sp.]